MENLAPSEGVFLTPMWFGIHDGTFDLYDSGSPISSEMERLAEDGDTAPLSNDFTASGAGSGQGTIPGFVGAGGPIDPGETVFFTIDVDPLASTSRYFSYASMVIPSNDAFIANGDPMAHTLFDMTGTFQKLDFTVMGSMVLDAGSEVNDELPANTAFFGQMTPDTGVDENGVVGPHPGFIPGGPILSSAMFANADFTDAPYPVARISVSAVPEPGTITLFGLGLVGLAVAARRRRR